MLLVHNVKIFSNGVFVMGQGIKKRFYKEHTNFLFLLYCNQYYMVRATVDTLIPLLFIAKWRFSIKAKFQN